MKLLSKNEVRTQNDRDHDELFQKNTRLATYLAQGIKKFNSIKDNYDQDKIRKQRDFDDFCNKLNTKKSELLKDFTKWEKAVKEKKDLYYALVEKSDELMEREASIRNTEDKMKLRESFNLENEARIKAKLDILTIK